MKKYNKILLTSLIATTSVVGLATIAATGIVSTNQKSTVVDENVLVPGPNLGIDGITSNKQEESKPVENIVTNNASSFGTQQINLNESHGLSLKRASFVSRAQDTKYVLTVLENTKKEGVIYLINEEGEEAQQLEFTPGDTIRVGFRLNEGYENTHTVRELRTYGKSPNIFVPSRKDPDKTATFLVQMPLYADTLDKKTGESWFYDESSGIKMEPSFIKESIGVDGNIVDWTHGAFAGALNGYVYELTHDLVWTQEVQHKIYETFKNDDITNPIDIYFYMNGHKITFDVDVINLDIPSGWALHFKNNKNDSLSADGSYGEIYVPNGKTSKLAVGGAVSLGSSVKFRHYVGTDGIVFIGYDDTTWIVDDISNDPLERLGKK